MYRFFVEQFFPPHLLDRRPQFCVIVSTVSMLALRANELCLTTHISDITLVFSHTYMSTLT